MRAFSTISVATVSKSAADAQALQFLQGADGITMNRDRLLADAKAKALALVPGYKPPEPPLFILPGASGRAAFAMAVDAHRRLGNATPHDVVVADRLGAVLAGGDADVTAPLSENDVLALERHHFMALIRTSATRARIAHTLETGKPLRN